MKNHLVEDQFVNRKPNSASARLGNNLQLKAQMTGQPNFDIYPKSENEFFWKVVKAEIKFVSDADGTVEKAFHKQGGATIEAKKIE